MSQGLGVGRPFLGLIVLPIAGNAAEHFTAVLVAARDKMDLALAIALGSCVQVSPDPQLSRWRCQFCNWDPAKLSDDDHCVCSRD